jgi:predicted enzyme related to lactoylglutathione lyase
MAERTSYAPGTFSYAELATSDVAAAKGFYTALFSWDYDEQPLGDGQFYSLAQRDGKVVAALYNSEQAPHWNCYVTVESADAIAARAGELGANVVAPPFDVLTAGRMAVISDPTGAVLQVWEPRESIGATLVNQPGALTWNDLITPDPAAAAAFYAELFGWSAEEIPDAGGYRVIKNGERSNGGILARDPRMAETPANWMPYFGHEDVERLVDEVGGHGGQVLSGPMRMPAGTIAVLCDPQGAGFAVWSGSYDD